MTTVRDRPSRHAIRTLRAPLMRRPIVDRPLHEPISVGSSIVLWLLGGVAAVAVWLVAFGLIFSALAESHAQHGLYNDYRARLAAGTAPLNDAVSEGTPVALLDSSRAELQGVVVVQGTSSSALRAGPGHQPGTPLPGQPGVSLLMGRSSSYGAPFGHLTALRKGDRITVTTGQGRFRYVVEDVRQPGDPFPATLAPNGSQLTLVTAGGDGWRSGWAPTHAVFVDAVLRGSTVLAQPGSGVATARDGVLKNDTRGMYPLVLWLQLLVVAVVGGVWAQRRWGQWQSWIAIGPVVAAALWGASTSVWLLFPNVL